MEKMTYKIPVYVRSTQIGDNGWWGKSRCMHVDEVGLFVYYNKPEDLTLSNIRRHITGRHKEYRIVSAESPNRALKDFYEIHAETRVGGDLSPESKAMWIDTSTEAIIEYTDCKNIKENDSGQIRCGEGEYSSGCHLDGYDGNDECPILLQDDEIYDRKTGCITRYEILIGRKWDIEVIGGFRFLRHKNLINRDKEPSLQLQFQL